MFRLKDSNCLCEWVLTHNQTNTALYETHKGCPMHSDDVVAILETELARINEEALV